jgi:hypothetical protein
MSHHAKMHQGNKGPMLQSVCDCPPTDRNGRASRQVVGEGVFLYHPKVALFPKL